MSDFRLQHSELLKESAPAKSSTLFDEAYNLGSKLKEHVEENPVAYAVGTVAVLGAAAYLTRGRWMPSMSTATKVEGLVAGNLGSTAERSLASGLTLSTERSVASGLTLSTERGAGAAIAGELTAARRLEQMGKMAEQVSAGGLKLGALDKSLMLTVPRAESLVVTRRVIDPTLAKGIAGLGALTLAGGLATMSMNQQNGDVLVASQRRY